MDLSSSRVPPLVPGSGAAAAASASASASSSSSSSSAARTHAAARGAMQAYEDAAIFMSRTRMVLENRRAEQLQHFENWPRDRGGIKSGVEFLIRYAISQHDGNPIEDAPDLDDPRSVAAFLPRLKIHDLGGHNFQIEIAQSSGEPWKLDLRAHDPAVTDALQADFQTAHEALLGRAPLGTQSAHAIASEIFRLSEASTEPGLRSSQRVPTPTSTSAPTSTAAAANEQLDALIQQIRDLQNEMADLRSELNDSVQQAEERQQVVENHFDEAERALRQNNDDLRRALQATEEHADTARFELERSRQTLEQLTAQLDDARRTGEQNSLTIRSLENRLAYAEAQTEVAVARARTAEESLDAERRRFDEGLQANRDVLALLRSELENLRQALSTAQATAATASSENATLRQQNSNLLSQISTLQARILLLEGELDRARESLRLTEQTRASLERELTTGRATVERLRTQLGERDTELARTREETATQIAEIARQHAEALRTRDTQANARQTDLTTALNQLTAEVASLRQDLSQRNAAAVQLQASNEELQTQLREQTARLAELGLLPERIRQLETDLSAALQSAADTTATNTQLQALQAAAEARSETLDRELRQQQAAVTESQRQQRNLSEQLGAQTAELDQLRTRAADVERATEAATQRATALQQQVAGSQRRITELEAEQQALLQRQETLQARETDQAAQIDTLNNDLSALRTERDNLQLAHATAQQGADQARQQQTLLEQQVQEATARIATLEENLATANQNLATATQRLDALQRENVQLTEARDALQVQLAQLQQAQQERVEAARARVTQSMADLTSRAAAAQRQAQAAAAEARSAIQNASAEPSPAWSDAQQAATTQQEALENAQRAYLAAIDSWAQLSPAERPAQGADSPELTQARTRLQTAQRALQPTLASVSEAQTIEEQRLETALATLSDQLVTARAVRDQLVRDTAEATQLEADVERLNTELPEGASGSVPQPVTHPREITQNLRDALPETDESIRSLQAAIGAIHRQQARLRADHTQQDAQTAIQNSQHTENQAQLRLALISSQDVARKQAAQLLASQAARGGLERQLRTATDETIPQLREELVRQRALVAEQATQLASFTQQIAERTETNARLAQKLEESQQAQAQSQNRIEEQTREIARLNQQLAQVSTDQSELTQQRDTLTERLRQAEARATETERISTTEREAAHRVATENTNKITQLNVELGNRDNTIKGLRDAIKALEEANRHSETHHAAVLKDRDKQAAALTAELTEVKARMTTLQAEHRQLVQTEAQARSEHAAARNELQTQIEAAEQQSTGLTAEITTLTTELARKETEITGLSARRDELTRRNTALQQRATDLERQLAQKTSESTQALQDIQTQLDTQGAELAQVRTELESVRQESERSLAEKTATNQSLQLELETARQDQSRFQRELETQKRNSAEAAQAAAAVKTALEEQLLASRADLDHVRTTLSSLLQGATGPFTDISAALEAVRTELVQARTRAEEANRRVQETEQALKSANQALEEANQRASTAFSERDLAREESSRVGQDAASAQAQVAEKERELSTARRELDEAKRSLQQLESQAQREAGAARVQLEASQQNVERLTLEKQSLLERSEALQKELTEAQSSLDEQAARNVALEETLTAVRQEVANQTAKNQDLSNEIDQVKQDANRAQTELQARLSELQQTLESTSVALEEARRREHATRFTLSEENLKLAQASQALRDGITAALRDSAGTAANLQTESDLVSALGDRVNQLQQAQDRAERSAQELEATLAQTLSRKVIDSALGTSQADETARRNAAEQQQLRDQLAAQRQAAEEALSAKQQELTTLNSKITALSANLATAKDANNQALASFRAQLDELQAAFARLNQKSSKDRTSLEAALRDQATELSTRDAEISALKDRLATAEAQIKAFEEANNELNQEKAALELEMSQVKAGLERAAADWQSVYESKAQPIREWQQQPEAISGRRQEIAQKRETLERQTTDLSLLKTRLSARQNKVQKALEDLGTFEAEVAEFNEVVQRIRSQQDATGAETARDLQRLQDLTYKIFGHGVSAAETPRTANLLDYQRQFNEVLQARQALKNESDQLDAALQQCDAQLRNIETLQNELTTQETNLLAQDQRQQEVTSRAISTLRPDLQQRSTDLANSLNPEAMQSETDPTRLRVLLNQNRERLTEARNQIALLRAQTAQLGTIADPAPMESLPELPSLSPPSPPNQATIPKIPDVEEAKEAVKRRLTEEVQTATNSVKEARRELVQPFLKGGATALLKAMQLSSSHRLALAEEIAKELPPQRNRSDDVLRGYLAICHLTDWSNIQGLRANVEGMREDLVRESADSPLAAAVLAAFNTPSRFQPWGNSILAIETSQEFEDKLKDAPPREIPGLRQAYTEWAVGETKTVLRELLHAEQTEEDAKAFLKDVLDGRASDFVDRYFPTPQSQEALWRLVMGFQIGQSPPAFAGQVPATVADLENLTRVARLVLQNRHYGVPQEPVIDNDRAVEAMRLGIGAAKASEELNGALLTHEQAQLMIEAMTKYAYRELATLDLPTGGGKTTMASFFNNLLLQLTQSRADVEQAFLAPSVTAAKGWQKQRELIGDITVQGRPLLTVVDEIHRYGPSTPEDMDLEVAFIAGNGRDVLNVLGMSATPAESPAERALTQALLQEERTVRENQWDLLQKKRAIEEDQLQRMYRPAEVLSRVPLLDVSQLSATLESSPNPMHRGDSHYASTLKYLAQIEGARAKPPETIEGIEGLDRLINGPLHQLEFNCKIIEEGLRGYTSTGTPKRPNTYTEDQAKEAWTAMVANRSARKAQLQALIEQKQQELIEQKQQELDRLESSPQDTPRRGTGASSSESRPTTLDEWKIKSLKDDIRAATIELDVLSNPLADLPKAAWAKLPQQQAGKSLTDLFQELDKRPPPTQPALNALKQAIALLSFMRWQAETLPVQAATLTGYFAALQTYRHKVKDAERNPQKAQVIKDGAFKEWTQQVDKLDRARRAPPQDSELNETRRAISETESRLQQIALGAKERTPIADRMADLFNQNQITLAPSSPAVTIGRLTDQAPSIATELFQNDTKIGQLILPLVELDLNAQKQVARALLRDPKIKQVVMLSAERDEDAIRRGQPPKHFLLFSGQPNDPQRLTRAELNKQCRNGTDHGPLQGPTILVYDRANMQGGDYGVLSDTSSDRTMRQLILANLMPTEGEAPKLTEADLIQMYGRVRRPADQRRLPAALRTTQTEQEFKSSIRGAQEIREVACSLQALQKKWAALGKKIEAEAKKASARGQAPAAAASYSGAPLEEEEASRWDALSRDYHRLDQELKSSLASPTSGLAEARSYEPDRHTNAALAIRYLEAQFAATELARVSRALQEQKAAKERLRASFSQGPVSGLAAAASSSSDPAGPGQGGGSANFRRP